MLRNLVRFIGQNILMFLWSFTVYGFKGDDKGNLLSWWNKTRGVERNYITRLDPILSFYADNGQNPYCVLILVMFIFQFMNF